MTRDVDLTIAHGAATIGARIIAQHRPELAECRVLYLLTTQERRSHGKLKAADVRLLNPLLRYFSSALDSNQPAVADGYDALVLIDATLWGTRGEAWQEALIDHELMHLTADPDDSAKFKLRGHDIEEFTEVIQRHGVWGGETESELAAFVRAAQQIGMPLGVDADTGEILDPDAGTPSEPVPSSEFERMRERALAMPAGRRVQ